MEHGREHREHGQNGGVDVLESVDTVRGDGVTVTVRASGARHPECGSIPGIGLEFKPATMRGGARVGAGRKPKPPSVAVMMPGQAGPRWYVARVDRRAVRCRGQESWADALERLIGEAGWSGVVPQYRTAADVLLPAFPGYLLIEFDKRDPAWRVIPHLQGVGRLIGPDAERPMAVVDVQAAWVLAQFGPEGVQRRPLQDMALAPLAAGVMVRVVGGLGLGWTGRVLESDGRSVVLEVDGRRVKMAQAGVVLAMQGPGALGPSQS